MSIGINAQSRTAQDLSVQERARRLEPFIVLSAQRYGLDPRLLRIVCYLESRFRLEAISPKGARGPMQFMPDTAARYGLTSPHDPQSAIDAGARYFRDLLQKFNGRVDLALAAYNAGEGTVDAFLRGRSLRTANGKVINPSKRITGGIPPYRETREYVRSAISFLTNKTTSPKYSPGIKPGIRNSNSATLSRDFSIDVTISGPAPPLTPNHTSKSFFIEIR